MSFFCLWIPQFAALTYARNEPELRDCAFAVCNGGIVSAASLKAQEAGVHAGMTNKRARSVLADLILVKRDLVLEANAWNEIQGALYEITPQIEAVQPGLLFAQLDARKALPLLQAWQARAGQGNDRATAQLAALTAEIGEVRCVRASREAPFADRVPIETLLLAGASTSALEQLKSLGWKSIGALRVLTLAQLEDQIGCEAEKVYRLAQGPKFQANTNPVSSLTPAEELSASISFELPAREVSEWEDELNAMLDQLHGELDGREARTLELRIETPVASLSARRILKASALAAESLQLTVQEAVIAALQSMAPLPPVILGIEVRLGILANHPNNSLFGCEEVVKAERPSRWHTVMQSIETRFIGKNRVSETNDKKAKPAIQESLSLFPALETIIVQDTSQQKMRVIR